MSVSSVHSTEFFLETFQLANLKQVCSFFPNRKDSSFENMSVLMKRMMHYFKTRVWINRDAVLEYINAHRKDVQSEGCKISQLFKGMPFERKIKQCEAGIFIPKPPYLQRLEESALFFLRFMKSSKTVGSVAPSSKQLAKTIACQILKPACIDQQAKRLILEVGPGTGAFTDKIINRMGLNDELHLVEYDDHFCQLLKQKYHCLVESGRLKIFCRSILDHTIDDSSQYDFIVSGLPLNAFEASFVEDVFKKYESITKKGGKISYFEYMLLPEIAKLVMEKTARKNLCDVLELKKRFYATHKLTTDPVWNNLTPAYVRHHQIKG